MIEKRYPQLDRVCHAHSVCLDEEVVDQPSLGIEVKHSAQGIPAPRTGEESFHKRMAGGIALGGDTGKTASVQAGFLAGLITRDPAVAFFQRAARQFQVLAEFGIPPDLGRDPCQPAEDSCPNDPLGLLDRKVVGVEVIAGEEFVGALSAEAYDYVLSCQLRNVVERDRCRICDRLVHVPDVARHKLEKLFGSYVDLMMVGR